MLRKIQRNGLHYLETIIASWLKYEYQIYKLAIFSGGLLIVNCIIGLVIVWMYEH